MRAYRKLCFVAAAAIMCGSPLQPLAYTPVFEESLQRGSAYAVPVPDFPVALRMPAPLPAAPRSAPAFPVNPPGPARYGVFGSTALPAGQLKGVGDWQRVKDSVLATRRFACPEGVCTSPDGRRLFQIANVAAALPAPRALEMINRAVNRQIDYRADRGDEWATLAETVRRGYGDCEDFAIAKMTLLRQAGFAASDVQLVVLKDTRSQLYHAVVAVHVDGERYILDNLSNAVATDTIFRTYRPIASYAGERGYLHGFTSRASRLASAG